LPAKTAYLEYFHATPLQKYSLYANIKADFLLFKKKGAHYEKKH